MTKGKLQARKQQVVRDAIYDAAIGLFTVNGFDATTIDEIVQAAGISRRSFFHYYATKDDLLAQNSVNYGVALVEAVMACPATFTPYKMLQQTVFAGIKYTAEQPRTRQIIEISQRSTAARQAQASRLVELEDRVSAAYAQQLKNASKFGMEPRLLAHLTISVMKVAITGWFTGEYQDLSTSAKQVLAKLTRLTSDETRSAQFRSKTAPARRLMSASIPRKSRSRIAGSSGD